MVFFRVTLVLTLLFLAFSWPQSLQKLSWLELTGELSWEAAEMKPLSLYPAKTWFASVAENHELSDDFRKWAQERKGRLFFPLKDIRSKPTLRALSLVEMQMSGPLRLEILARKDAAPVGQWGDFEPVAAALMSVATKLGKEDYELWTRSVVDVDTLLRAAAWLQREPRRALEQAQLHGRTPATLMGALYDQIEIDGEALWSLALELGQEHPRAYERWLDSGKGIEMGWRQRWWERLGQRFEVLPSLIPVLPTWGGWIPSFLALLAAASLLISKGGRLKLTGAIAVAVLALVALELRLPGSASPLELQWMAAATPSSSSAPIPPTPPPAMDSQIDQRTIQLTVLFLLLQVGVFILSAVAVNKLKKLQRDAETKLKLLDNDETLFDLGLYIGLGGTVLSFLFILLGSEGQGMMAAYTSTLFGIVEVAVFKVTVLRPYRKSLIVQAQT